jgi:O-glycosyl hydrolase
MKLLAYFAQKLSYCLIYEAADRTLHMQVQQFPPNFGKNYPIAKWTIEETTTFFEARTAEIAASAQERREQEYTCLECDNPVEQTGTFCSHNCYVDSL